jgi:hypothetical protein
MKITKKEKPESGSRVTITMKTTDHAKSSKTWRWWEAGDEKTLAAELCSTVSYLKESQGFRQRQAALYARLYGNQSLFSFIGSNISKLDRSAGLPPERPTFNLVSSVVDTLVSRLTQSRPAPVFLTDNSDYKERNLAKKLNNFILGEFYQMKAYEKAEYILTDALVEGTGCLKVYESDEHKVAIDRVLLTELFVDLSEGIYGDPRSIYQVKLMDRDVLEATFEKKVTTIKQADKATPDDTGASAKTISDLVLVVEGWHLPSAKGAGDGRHTIACSAGVLLDEEWKKMKFPFVFLHHRKRMLGFWSQGVAETLMGTQLELNSILSTIARAIKLVGVPRVFIEDGSKVVKSHNSNEIGVMITYQGTKPSYEVAPCNAQELYLERDRLIQYGYQQEGLSAMSASSQKPAGLNSGEAIRTYDDINTDRFAALSRRYDQMFVDLAYQVIGLASEISEREGKYQTIYPDKKGTKEIDLPNVDLEKDPFVIQCFNESSLPRDPAGRKQTIIEMIQSRMLTIKEGRRLLNYPDLEQIETLANASEERIFCYLDLIVEDGDYSPPDPLMDLALAEELVVEYYNLYEPRKLERDRCDMLLDFHTQIQDLKKAAMPPAPLGSSGAPLAVPAKPPVSDALPLPTAQAA